MAVTRGTTRSRSGFIFPPFRSDQVWKITITDSSGNVIDLTSNISKFKINDYCTESIGDFSFEIYDPTEYYASLWSGNEIFKYYEDYGTTATTLKFRGRLEKISKSYHKLIVNGRREDVVFFNKKVTLQATDTDTSTILNTMRTTYATTFTGTGIQTSGVTLTINWVEKDWQDCIKELCNASGFDFYTSADLDFKYFSSGSNKNYIDAVSHDYNLLDIGEFTPDLTLVKNRITVYGATLDNVRLIYTSEDTSSQSSYGIKEEIITDENISSFAQIVEVADYELSVKKDPPVVGSVKSFLLVTNRPGDSIYISDSADRLVPGFYVCNGYTDSFDIESGEYYTELHLNKEIRKVSHVLKDRIVAENKNTNNSTNPYGLKYSYLFTFDDDTGTHSSTAILNGQLYPTSSSGTWISPIRITSGSIGEVYLNLNAQNINNIVVSYSTDGGTTYQTISNNQYSVVVGGSNSLVIKVVFSNSTSSVQSMSLMYSLV